MVALSKLRRRDVAQTDVTNEPLTLQLREHCQRLFNRTVRPPHHPAHSKIDDIKRLAAEISQVVVHAVDQLLTRERMEPGLVGASTSAQLRDDHSGYGWSACLIS